MFGRGGRGRGGGFGQGRGHGSEQGGTSRGGIIGGAVKGIASGIGFISERNKARKAERADQSSSANAAEDQLTQDTNAHDDDHADDIPPPYSEQQLSAALAMEWELDDASTSISSENQSPDTRTTDQIVDAFLHENMRHYDVTFGHLEYPVLLPQRRPKDRTRGFIRAYAPSLQACDIDERQWLAFLDTFEKASQASRWIMALNLASFATLALPTVTGIAVSRSIQVATKIASETQSTYKTNTFLDKINQEFFQPRGLYCLVMTWNPESDATQQAYDLDTMVSQAVGRRKNKLKSSDGNTYGESLFPLGVAPLTFPALDQLSQENDHAKMSKLTKEKVFLNDYFDRRATASYAAQNPDSILATSVQQPEFTSRYADPNHPASSGDLIALITGGKLSRGRGIVPRQQDQAESSSAHAVTGRGGFAHGQRGSRGQGLVGGRLDGRGGGIAGGALAMMSPKKLLAKNVLYLLVVNMPSEAELATGHEYASQLELI